MEIDLLFFLTVVPAIILFGVAKSGLGGSVSLISIPLMTFVMPLNQALAILLPILIFSDFISAFKFRKEFDLKTLKLMVPFAAIGAIIGASTFSFFSESYLKFILGLMGFAFAFHYFFLKKDANKPVAANYFKGAICSSVAGFTSFCAHSGGTPTSIYLLPLRLKKEIYVGTRIIFFTCINLVKLPFYLYLSMVNTSSFTQSLILLPLSVFGIFVGYKLLKIIEESLFYKVIYILILVASTKLIIDFFYAI